MQDIWQRIEAWLATNAPEILEDLLPGAHEEAIHTIEEQVGIQFPDDVKASYTIHDGQRETAPALMGEWALLSLQAIARQWSPLKALYDAGTFPQADALVEAHAPVRANWWNIRWIPMTHNGAGDFYCLDMDPAPWGSQGQVITFWHMDTKREKIADSFRSLMQKFADDLYAGRYKVEHGKLVMHS
jgi:cell wall assembly regulator SMI1